MSNSVIFRNISIFDGKRFVAQMNVLTRAGRIQAVARQLEIPSDCDVIDGTEKTLLPGLIDSHTHAFSREDLTTAITLGVTTEFDMGNDYKLVEAMKREISVGDAPMADLRSAGTLVTVPNGHGTECGIEFPTITGADEAAKFVDGRIREGSDYLKLIFEDGSAYGFTLPTMDAATIASLVRAAHGHNKLAIAHISSLHGAHLVLDAGADGLAHLFEDERPDPGFAARVRDAGAFVIPTLTVLECATGVPSGATIAEDRRISEFLPPAAQSCMEMTFSRFPGQKRLKFAYAQEAVLMLKQAGVPLLAGTDAGNPGTAHGASLHRELELLVAAGLTPEEALASATSVPAQVFGLQDRGMIEPGKRADLVLISGKVEADITNTRNIEGVWKGGVPIDRARIAQSARKAYERGPAGSESGLISDFKDGTARTHFGLSWMPCSDSMSGGKSSVAMRVADGAGIDGCRGLVVEGEVDPALPEPWAGIVFHPGGSPFVPSNLSSKKTVRFWARGDGGQYHLVIQSWKKGVRFASQPFRAGELWQEHIFAFSQFGTDGHKVMAMLLLAVRGGTKFLFQLDSIRID